MPTPPSLHSSGSPPRIQKLQGTPALAAPGSRAPESTPEVVRVTSLESFDVYHVSLDACRAAAPISASLTANLKDQLLRASSSVVLNTAEGFGSSSRGVKRRHYEIARGSAVECIAALDLASPLGIVDGTATGLAACKTRARIKNPESCAESIGSLRMKRGRAGSASSLRRNR